MKKARIKRFSLRLLCCLLALSCMTTAAFAKKSNNDTAIQACKDAWQEAYNRGDKAGMEAAHAAAESIRASEGYSGGSDGSQHISISTSSSGGGGSSSRDYSSYSSSSDYTGQMAANSAAWNETSDKEAQAALHVQNAILSALKDANTGSSSSFSSSTGSWTSNNSDGSVTTSIRNGVGSNVRISFQTTGGDIVEGSVEEAVVWAYEKAANEALLSVIGDTAENRQKIVDKYNADSKIVGDNTMIYGIEGYKRDEAFKADGVLQEADLYELITGKTISEEDRQTLLENKALYRERMDEAEAAIRNGRSKNDVLEEYRAIFNELNAQNEAIREKYGYSANGAYRDGGFFYIEDQQYRTMIDDVGVVDGSTSNNAYLVSVYFNEGGTVSPGTRNYPKGSNQTFTFTPEDKYFVASVVVDGVNKGSRTSYTLSDIQAPHTIFVTFSNAKMDIRGAEIKTDTASKDGTIKAGYGLDANVDIAMEGGENARVEVTASWDFGQGHTGSTSLSKDVDGKYRFPVNPTSKIGARKIYIPPTTKDGDYYITVEAKLYVNEELVDTKTVRIKITVRGTMYEDDFTGDRR